jgi:hypothetical protein
VDAGGKIPTTAQQVDTITKRSKDDADCYFHGIFYLSTRLAGCSVDPEISCGTCKLARTPQVTKQKKKMMSFVLLDG